MANEVLLEVKDLHTSFNVTSGEVRSVNGVSFTLRRGEVLGIVGESGSGKSVTAYSIMQIVGKSTLFNKLVGKKISIIFQDAMSSLNPVWSIGDQLMEAVRIHEDAEVKAKRKARIKELKAEIKVKKANNEDYSELAKELDDKVGDKGKGTPRQGGSQRER